MQLATCKHFLPRRSLRLSQWPLATYALATSLWIPACAMPAPGTLDLAPDTGKSEREDAWFGCLRAAISSTTPPAETGLTAKQALPAARLAASADVARSVGFAEGVSVGSGASAVGAVTGIVAFLAVSTLAIAEVACDLGETIAAANRGPVDDSAILQFHALPKESLARLRSRMIAVVETEADHPGRLRQYSLDWAWEYDKSDHICNGIWLPGGESIGLVCHGGSAFLTAHALRKLLEAGPAVSVTASLLNSWKSRGYRLAGWIENNGEIHALIINEAGDQRLLRLSDDEPPGVAGVRLTWPEIYRSLLERITGFSPTVDGALSGAQQTAIYNSIRGLSPASLEDQARLNELLTAGERALADPSLSALGAATLFAVCDGIENLTRNVPRRPPAVSTPDNTAYQFAAVLRMRGLFLTNVATAMAEVGRGFDNDFSFTYEEALDSMRRGLVALREWLANTQLDPTATSYQALWNAWAKRVEAIAKANGTSASAIQHQQIPRFSSKLPAAYR